MAHFEKTLHSEELYRGHILTLMRDTVALEDGRESKREIIRHVPAAAILPVTDDGTVYLVRQYRYAIGRETLEIPAGKADPGEEPLDAAVRELREETGLVAGQVDCLGSILPSTGYTDEVIWLYLARDLTMGSAQPDPGEFVTLEERSFEELRDMCMSGAIQDAKTVAAVLKAAVLMNRTCQTARFGKTETGPFFLYHPGAYGLSTGSSGTGTGTASSRSARPGPTSPGQLLPRRRMPVPPA